MSTYLTLTGSWQDYQGDHHRRLEKGTLHVQEWPCVCLCLSFFSELQKETTEAGLAIIPDPISEHWVERRKSCLKILNFTETVSGGHLYTSSCDLSQPLAPMPSVVPHIPWMEETPDTCLKTLAFGGTPVGPLPYLFYRICKKCGDSTNSPACGAVLWVLDLFLSGLL